MITVEWQMHLPSMANARLHWAVKAKRTKAQRAATALMLRSKGLKWTPSEGRRLAIRLTRISPRMLDDDNLVSAFKGCRDQVAAHFGLDDRDPRIRFEYAQRAGKPSAVRIDVDVDDLRGLREMARANGEAAEAQIAADVARLVPR